MCDIRWVVAFLISSHLLGTGLRSEIVPVSECRDYLSGKTPIRVGVASGVGEVELKCARPAKLRLGGKTVNWPAGKRLSVAPGASGIVVGSGAGQQAAPLCVFEPPSGAETEVLAGGSSQGRYPGSVEVSPDAAGLKVVNTVPLETYLLGVVPAEMPSSFPMEALKAQAILARTYALYQLGTHEAEGFDLCSGVHCQVYRGAAASARTTRAVEATAGYVMAVDGVLAKAVYHSTCGGATADAWNAWWGHLLPYLRGRPDGAPHAAEPDDSAVARFLSDAKGWCASSSKYRWQVQMSWGEIREKVAENLAMVTDLNGRAPGNLLDLRIAARAPSGRVRRLAVVTDSGEERVWGDSIRWLFGMGKPGPGGLPSTLFTLDVRRDSDGNPVQVTFTGGGWGHGIGMCQVGAAARARAGQTARQILDAYYTGVQVVKVQ